MPIYEFQCKKCGRKFECMMRLTRRQSTAKCPRCGASAPRKLSAFALVRGAPPDLMRDDLSPQDLGGGGDDF
ncbi:MAG: zinc ribbon domain-containing protein [Dehalococcoidia bacterium]|nr:zinc ribbon domain-containing protein [Dehalococcoidia bacterium]